MAFEDFLRSIPVVHKHIMRTRRLMHENKKLREFLENNGINAHDVIAQNNDVDGESLKCLVNILPNTDIETAFKTVSTSLRAEQKRATNLETSLYVLQIDYNNLLLQSKDGITDAGYKPCKSSPQNHKPKE